MSEQIGIPRALLFHEFGSFWTNFFDEIGVSCIVSPQTNRSILDRGTMLAIDESCLPLKIYLGHVESLLNQCSHIFVPRITEFHPEYYLCPKFAGLPDIVRNTFTLLPSQIISPNFEGSSWLQRLKAIQTTSKSIQKNIGSGCLAFWQASKCYRQKICAVETTEQKIALIGHSYLLQDAFFCRDIFSVLAERKIRYTTSDDISPHIIYRNAQCFQPDIYWQLSFKIAGAVKYFSQQPNIAGIILISSFGCGPDSLCNEYLDHHILKTSHKPYLIITLDEHTGSAGIVTRVEAFLDLLDWRAII